MAVPTKQGVPSAIQAGDTTIFTKTLDGYPASSWTAEIYLTANGIPLTGSPFSGTSSGDDFKFTITAAETALLAPGYANYYIRATETSTGQVDTVDNGGTFISPDPTAGITQTPSMLALAAARAKFTELVSGKFQSTSFNGQTYTLQNIIEFQKVVDRLQAIVNAELRDLGVSKKGGARKIVTRFVS